MMRAFSAGWLLLLAIPMGATAQQALPVRSVVQPSQQADDPTQQGRVADSAVGKVGERQRQIDNPNTQPLARIDSRIQNRVASRLTTRIDRYSRTITGTTAFSEAAEDSRRPNRRTRR